MTMEEKLYIFNGIHWCYHSFKAWKHLVLKADPTHKLFKWSRHMFWEQL